MSDTREGWEARAYKANMKGWELLNEARKCFELAEIAKAQAANSAQKENGNG